MSILNIKNYPSLNQEHTWAWGPVKVKFELGMPPERLLSNVNIVPYDQNGWLVVRQQDRWGIIGGTMEPNESYSETIRRELMEEAGCELINFTVFGALRMEFLTGKPYRPHLPFPVSYRLLGVGEVKRIGEPTNPEEAEQILEVASFPIEKTCQLLKKGEDDGPLLADIYRYGANFLEQEQKED